MWRMLLLLLFLLLLLLCVLLLLQAKRGTKFVSPQNCLDTKSPRVELLSKNGVWNCHRGCSHNCNIMTSRGIHWGGQHIQQRHRGVRLQQLSFSLRNYKQLPDTSNRRRHRLQPESGTTRTRSQTTQIAHLYCECDLMAPSAFVCWPWPSTAATTHITSDYGRRLMMMLMMTLMMTIVFVSAEVNQRSQRNFFLKRTKG